jgi:hypothetical protein
MTYNLPLNFSFPHSNGGVEEEITFSEPAEATEQPARQDLYTEVVKLEQSSSISQMLAQPDFQYSQTWYKNYLNIFSPVGVMSCLSTVYIFEIFSDFHPRHKHLIAKRSQRCRVCFA